MSSSFHFRTVLGILVCALVIVQNVQSRQGATSKGTGVLSTSRDTVYGVYDEQVILQSAAWLPKETILVHNTSEREVVLDSFSLRQDSSIHSERLYFDFAVKQITGNTMQTYRFLDFRNGQTNALPLPIRIPARDSILLGQFGMDERGVVEKVGASSIRYKAGDSIFTPLAFFSGNDSVKFQLRAKVMNGVLYRPISIKGSAANATVFSTSNGFLANGRHQINSSSGMRVPLWIFRK